MRRAKNEKYCPILDKPCLKADCAIYNDLLDTCQIGLLNYNLFQLMTVMRQQIEIEVNKRI